MWYPPQQQQHHPHQNQQQRWLGYNQHLSSQQHQQSCSTTSYYCTSNEPSTTNRTTNTYVGSRNDENEAFNQYHSNRADDVYVTGADYYVTPSTGSYSDEMSSSSLPHQTSNTYWNPVIAAPTKTSLVTTTINQSPTPSSSMLSTSSSACWDWLLYSPEIYSHLYRPSSSFIQQHIKDEDLDLSTCLPSWLLALLYPSMKQIYSADDENDNDQEISSLHNNNNTDESLLSMNIDKNITHVSSNVSLSSENTLNQQKLTQNRSSTPDTDDGYQSASDASRSDYSQQSSLHYDHHNSKNNLNILMPKRISYAAAAKPLTTSLSNNQTSPLATPIIKMKNNSSSSSSSITNDLASTSGQKLKFIAPRFERMHHAKQYSSSIVTTTTTSTKDLSSSSSSSSSSLYSSTSFTNRTTIRSNNNNNHHHYHHHPRNHIINAMRRR
ncbi:unnamed protein product [Adineta ricciae]|uniref:Uncharacterized protein n=2 Tax=Adineta ricciae TaxID=249248 RepID=A0A814GKL2_ADIRI|nr:unnamed protein product [Adineta ricciae]